MISFVILHYNRLFMLEANVRILRHYAPEGSQIIVADDGSKPEFIDYIKALPIDDIYVQESNINAQHKGSCSNTLNKAFSLANHEYISFSEDDFFFSSRDVTWHGKGTPNDGDIMPDIRYDENVDFCFYRECIDLLKTQPHIKLIQMARDTMHDAIIPLGNKLKTSNTTWYEIDHSKMKKFYYCNWPWLMKTEDWKQIGLGSNLSITGVENTLNTGFNKAFGKGSWSACPRPPRYLHCGRGFSNNFASKGSRKTQSLRMQKEIFGKIQSRDSKDVNVTLSQMVVEGRFNLSMNDIITYGLNEAYERALK